MGGVSFMNVSSSKALDLKRSEKCSSDGKFVEWPVPPLEDT